MPAAVTDVHTDLPGRTAAAPSAGALPCYKYIGDYGSITSAMPTHDPAPAHSLPTTPRAWLEQLEKNHVIASRYVLDTRLRRDASAVTWSCVDRTTGGHIAIKLMAPEDAADAAALMAALGELVGLRTIRHPNICRVFDSGQGEHGLCYLTQELVPGESLRQRVQRGALPTDVAFDMLAQVCEGVAAVHANGVLHGELNAENIIVRKDGRIVLVDFGLTRSAGMTSGEASASGSRARFRSMPPRPPPDEPLDVRRDIFGLGLVTREVLLGEGPGEADITATLQATGLPAPTAHAVGHVLRRAMTRDRQQRFASVRAFSQALAAARLGRIMERLVAEEEPPLPLGRLGVLGVMLLALISSGVVVLRDHLGARVATPALTAGKTLSVVLVPLERASEEPTLVQAAESAYAVIRTRLRTSGRVRLSELSRGSDVDKRAQAQGAAWLLDGTILEIGQKFRISVEFRALGDNLRSRPIVVEAAPIQAAADAVGAQVAAELDLIIAQQAFRRRADRTRSAAARTLLLRYYQDRETTGAAYQRSVLDDALRADPDYVPALVERATLLANSGDAGAQETAERDVAHALTLDPQDGPTLVLHCWLRAMSLLAAPHTVDDASFAQGESACTLALQHEPGAAAARYGMALLDAIACRYAAAAAVLDGLLRTDAPPVPRGLAAQIEHIAQAGQSELAERLANLLSGSVVDEAERIRLHMLHGGLLLHKGQVEQARLDYETVLALLGTGVDFTDVEAQSVEAAALRVLLNATTASPAIHQVRQKRILVLEGELERVGRHHAQTAAVIAQAYQWSDAAVATEWMARADAPHGCTAALDRALFFLGIKDPEHAARALAPCTAGARWQQTCERIVRQAIRASDPNPAPPPAKE